MKTKKFFTNVQNFWAPKISEKIFAESDNFYLSGIKIPEHYQKSEISEVIKFWRNLR